MHSHRSMHSLGPTYPGAAEGLQRHGSFNSISTGSSSTTSVCHCQACKDKRALKKKKKRSRRQSGLMAAFCLPV